MDAACKPTWREIAIIFVVLALVCVCGMLWGQSSRETSEGRGTQASGAPFHFWRSTVAVTVGSICLLAGPSVATWTLPATKDLIARLHGDVLNARDLALQRRGYYEELDLSRMDDWRCHDVKEPEGWNAGRKVFYRERSDFLMKEIVPSVSTVLGGAPVTSNRLGMRDREYQKLKPPNTYRIVLFGVSHDVGTGVKDDQTYENLVEDRLNRHGPDAHYARYEILNMSTGADCVLQMLLRLEQIGFDLQPNAAMISVAAVDQQFLVEHLRKCLTHGIDPPRSYREFLDGINRKAGVNGQMPDAAIERRLLRYVPEIQEWVFRRFAQQCTQRGIHSLVIYRPAPMDFGGVEPACRSETVRLARAAGLEVIDLSPAFDSVADRNRLIVAKWDEHTSALGHRLLADKLYEGLVPLLFPASSIQQVSRFQKP